MVGLIALASNTKRDVSHQDRGGLIDVNVLQRGRWHPVGVVDDNATQVTT